MSNIKKLMMSAASGDQPLSVEDVFVTHLHEGNGSSKSISNGINLNTTDTTGAFTSLTLNYYQTSPQSSYREFYIGKIIEDSSGNFYAIITFKENYNGYEQNTLTKFSSSGEQVWSKRLQDTSSPRYADFDDMVLNSNGDLVITWTAASDNDRAKVNVLSASDGSSLSGASNSAYNTNPQNILHSGNSIYWTGDNSYSSIFIASETAPGTITGTRAIGLGSYTQRVMLIPQSSGGPVVVGFNSDQNSGTSTNGWIFTKLASNLQSSTYTTRHSHSNGSSTQYNSRYMAGGKQYYDSSDNMLYIFWRGTNSISGNTSHFNYISKFDMDDGSHVVSKRVYFNSASTSNIDATSITKFNNKIIACGSGNDGTTKQVILECSTDLSTISARTVTLPSYQDKLQIWGGTEKIYYMASDHGSHVEIRAIADFDIDTAVLGVTPTSSGITVTSASLTDTTTGYNNVSVSNGTATDNMGNSGGNPTDNTINMVESASAVPEILEPSPGGMVWVKRRESAADHVIQDTVRGVNKTLIPNSTYQEETKTDRLSSFDFTGFSVSNASVVNTLNQDYVSWTWRKTEKFFDIQTWTGNGVAGRTVSHNLGSTPGMIMVKRLDSSEDWTIYHRGMASADYIRLDYNTKQTGGARYRFGNDSIPVAPTSTQFTVSSNGAVNGSGGQYVAYLFAHNDSDGVFGPNANEDIIKCGSYTGDGNNIGGPKIDLGFEPQWLLVKCTTQSYDWMIFDSMRNFRMYSLFSETLRPNTTAADSVSHRINPLPDGFQINDNNGLVNQSGQSYIYVAIRRGLMNIPTSASDVFKISTQTGRSGDKGAYPANFPIDFHLKTGTTGGGHYLGTRLLHQFYLKTNSRDARASEPDFSYDYSYGYNSNTGSSSQDYSWMWRRARNYFDVITWKVDGTGNQTIPHNLGAIPEMVWTKNINDNGYGSGSWFIAHKDLTGWDSANENDRHVFQDFTTSASAQQGYHRDFTDTSIRLTSNAAGGYFTSHWCTGLLFASLDGVAKVGSYTGDGTSNRTIDCGFSNGIQYLILKNASSNSHWLVYDSVRGITTGADPFFELNSTSAQTTSADHIDPTSSGFIVNSAVNSNGHKWIFYAIAA